MAHLERTIPERAFATIFGPVRALDLVAEGAGRTLVVEAPARSVLWVQSAHGQELRAAVEAAGLTDVEVEMRPPAQGGAAKGEP